MKKFTLSTNKGEWSAKKTAITVSSLVLVVALLVGIVFGIAPKTTLRVSAATGVIDSVSGKNNIPNTYSAANVPAGTLTLPVGSSTPVASADGLAVFDFHIFAKNFASTAHTCGNIAVGNLGGNVLGKSGAPEFGSRKNHDTIESKLNYIENVISYGKSEDFDILVFGSGNEVTFNGRDTTELKAGGTNYMLSNRKDMADKIYVADADPKYIDIDAELDEAEAYQRYLLKVMQDVRTPANKVDLGFGNYDYVDQTQSVRVITYDDVAGWGWGGKTIDFSKYPEETIIVDLDSYYNAGSMWSPAGYANNAIDLLNGSINMKGTVGKRIIFNINTQQMKEMKFADTDMKADKLGNSESAVESDNNILFNFYECEFANNQDPTTKNYANATSTTKKITVGGTWVGTILAPKGQVDCKAGLNGSIIATDVTTSAETHKSDYTGEKQVGETTNITVTKYWADNNPAARPDYITVKLFQNKTVYKTIQMTGGTGDVWTYTFEDLPKADAMGNTYRYRIEEVVPKGYKGTVMNFDITNTSEGGYVAPTTYSLTVTKVKDGTSTKLDGAQFKLTAGPAENLSAATGNQYALNFKATDKEITWTSSKDGAAVISNLPKGKYNLTEVSAPAGYKLEPLAPDIKSFDLNANKTIEVKDKPIEAKFVKLEGQNRARLAGAKLTLTSNNGTNLSGIEIVGATVDSRTDNAINFTSGNDEIKFVAIPVGSYTVTETQAPDGYDLAAPVTFVVNDNGETSVNNNRVSRVEMVDEKTPEVKPEPVYHNITINKQNNSGTPVSGATFTLTNIAGEDISSATVTGATTGSAGSNSEIVFTTNGNTVTVGHLLAGNYVLTETGVPAGYKPANPVSITVSGDVNYTDVDNYTIINEPIVFNIAKKDSKSGANVVGATLRLVKPDGNTEWVTTDGVKTFTAMPAGSYTIKEIATPDGYITAADVTFTVDSYGNLSGANVSGNTVTMYDAPSVVEIGKKFKTLESVIGNLPGATLSLTSTSNKDLSQVTGTCAVEVSADKHTITWASGSAANSLRGLPNGNYVLHEVEAPEGYELAADVTFTVNNGQISNVTSDDPDTYSTTSTSVNLIDKKKPFYSLNLSKIDADKSEGDTGYYVPGAKLAIFDKDAKSFTEAEAVLVFESSDEPQNMMLRDGDYVLVELAPPEGYDRTDDKVYFTTKNGNLKITNVSKNELAVASYGNPSDNDGITIDAENCYYTLEATKIFAKYAECPTNVEFNLDNTKYVCDNFKIYKNNVEVSGLTMTSEDNGNNTKYSVDISALGDYDANATYVAVMEIKDKNTNQPATDVGNINLNFVYQTASSGEGEVQLEEIFNSSESSAAITVQDALQGTPIPVANESDIPKFIRIEFERENPDTPVSVYYIKAQLADGADYHNHFGFYAQPSGGPEVIDDAVELYFDEAYDYFHYGNTSLEDLNSPYCILLQASGGNIKDLSISLGYSTGSTSSSASATPNENSVTYTYNTTGNSISDYTKMINLDRKNKPTKIEVTLEPKDGVNASNIDLQHINVDFGEDPIWPGSTGCVYAWNYDKNNSSQAAPQLKDGKLVLTVTPNDSYFNAAGSDTSHEISGQPQLAIQIADKDNNPGGDYYEGKYELRDVKTVTVKVYYPTPGRTELSLSELQNIYSNSVDNLESEGGETAYIKLPNKESEITHQCAVKLTKEEAGNSATKLAGATFLLLDSKGQLVTNLVDQGNGVYTYDADATVYANTLTAPLITAADGTITVNGLDEGSYTFNEVSAPEYYKVNEDTATQFIVNLNHTTDAPKQVTVTNEKITGELVFIKTDDAGVLKEGEKFELHRVDNNGNDTIVTLGEDVVTKNDGKYTLKGLELGYLYYAKETVAAPGTALNTTEKFPKLAGGQCYIINGTEYNYGIYLGNNAPVYSREDNDSAPVAATEPINNYSGLINAENTATKTVFAKTDGAALLSGAALRLNNESATATPTIDTVHAYVMDGTELVPYAVTYAHTQNADSTWSEYITWESCDKEVIFYGLPTDGNYKVYEDQAPVGYKAAEPKAVVIDATNTIVNTKLTCELNLSATKFMSGRAMTSTDVFTFTLTGEGQNQSKQNNGSLVEFDAINYTYDADKSSYTYTIKETQVNVNGVTCDTAEYTVNVTLYIDEADGQLKTDVSVSKGSEATTEITFTNTYAAGGTTASINISKVLNGRNMAADEFSFVLKEGDTVLQTKKNPAANNHEAATITFDAIEYTQVGTYTYTVSEVKGSIGGVTYDETVKTVTVEVTDDGRGNLVAEVQQSAETLKFVNTYAAAGEATATVGGTKTLTGRPWANDDAFTIRITDTIAGTYEEATVTESNRDYSFTKTYGTSDIGKTFTYSIAEVNTGKGGITYDTTAYTWTVVVSDNGDGTVKAAATLTGGTSADFTNTYAATGSTSATVNGTKVLNGKALADNAFTFVLAGDATATTTNVDGRFSFTQNYTAAGTYNYTITEQNGGNTTPIEGITYDGKTYNWKVVVSDDGLGGFEVTENTLTLNGETVSTAAFTNEYTVAPTEATIAATKSYNKPLVGGDFEFELLDSNNNRVDGVVSNAADGTITFPAITYTAAGTYNYTVKEVVPTPAAGGVSYDTAGKPVTVTVVDNGDGTLTATVNKTAAQIVFTNEYATGKVSAAISATKSLTGRDLNAEEFSFTLYGSGNSAIETVKNDASGNINFSAIEYTVPGTYTYTIKENSGSVPGVTYDTDTETVTVTVTDNGDGTLFAVVDKAAADVVFENTYSASGVSCTVNGTKTLENATLAADEFTFKLYDSTGANELDSTTNAANGNFSFTKNFTAAGNYEYLIKEDLTDKEDGVVYDTTVYSWKVTVTDPGKGQLVAAGTVNKIGESELCSNAAFDNTAIKVTLSKVDITNSHELAGAELVIKYANGDVYDSWTSTNEKHVITKMPVGTYTLTETTAPNGYAVAETITFTVEADGTVKVGGNTVANNTVVMEDAHNKVVISKQAVGGGDELVGAVLTVKDSEGNVVESWTSTEDRHEIDMIPAGTYTLTETTAPNGYAVAETITFTVEANGTVKVNGEAVTDKTVVMFDAPNTVTISKVDITNSEELAGAELVIKDSHGAVYDSWTSTDEAHVINMIPAGTYTLTETTAPNGYAVAETITFTVETDGKITVNGSNVANKTVVMKDAPTKVTISKVDITNSEELAGAKLIIKNSEGTKVAEWTSTTEKHVIEKLAVGTYTLTEVTAPAGYAVAESITFTIEADGTVKVNGTAVANNTVVMKDAHNKVVISKQAVGGRDELVGAELTVKDSEGEVVETWTSTETRHEIDMIPAGTYTLTEVTAPDGYAVAETITFTVEEDGTVTVNGETVTDKTVVMFDAPTRVTISKVDITNSQELAGAELVIKDSHGTQVEKWTSTTEKHVINRLAAGEYTLTEITAPNGYAVAETITFTVGTDGKVKVNGEDVGNTIVMKDAPNKVYISKQAMGGGDELPGAKLIVRDSEGTKVAEWTSTDEKHEIDMIPTGTYTLTEITAPDGYDVAETITFVVEKDGTVKVNGETVTDKTVVMLDAPKAYISKVDMTNSQELPGAKLIVKDSEGTKVAEWISTNEKHDIGSLAEGTYTLTEITAPNGYAVAETITFTVDAKGIVKVNGEAVTGNTVVMKDAPNKVVISKQAVGGGDELPGAELIVKDSSGNEVAKWVSTDEKHEIDMIPAGEYTLTEITAPNGYAVAETITFVVEEDGTVTVNGETVDENTVVMLDAPNKVVISKQAVGGGDELPGAELIVRDSSGNEVEKWISTDEKHEIDMIPEGTYTLTEITAPNGYKVAETITFVVEKDGTVTVNGETVDENTVVMLDAPNKLVISKQAVGGGKELAGAKLTLTAVSGSDFTGYTAPEGVTLTEKTATWTSGDEEVTFDMVPDGIYTLTEVQAPAGYDIAEVIYIKVESGNIYAIASADYKGADTMWGATVADDTVIMLDALTPAPAETNFSFIKYNNVGAAITGAKFKLVGDNGYSQDVTSSSTGEVFFYGLTEGKYTLTETEAPKGHVKSAVAVTIVVDNKSEKTYFDASGNQISLSTIEGLMKNSIIPVYDEDKSHKPGDSVDLYDKLIKEHEEYADLDIKWTTSDPSIATVDEYGRVTFLKPGLVTITAKTEDGVELGSYVLGASDETPAVVTPDPVVTPSVAPSTGETNTAPVTGESIFWSVVAIIILALSTVTMIVIRRKVKKEKASEE